MKMKDRTDDLARRRARNEGMGGAERVKRQRERNKLDARERLRLLFDPGTLRGARAARVARAARSPRRRRRTSRPRRTG